MHDPLDEAIEIAEAIAGDRMDDERARKVEGCPVCGQLGNASGSKYCYGIGLEKHERARWEWVEVVPADQLRGAVDALRDLRNAAVRYDHRNEETAATLLAAVRRADTTLGGQQS